MTVQDLRTLVRQDLGDHLDALDQIGGRYADAYLDALVHGRRVPNKPTELHPQAACLVRELALDAVSAARGTIVA